MMEEEGGLPTLSRAASAPGYAWRNAAERGGLLTAIRRLAMDPGLLRAIVIVAALRLALGVAGWLALVLPPPIPTFGSWSDLLVSPSSRSWALLVPWQRWDALWYQHIAMWGYRPGHEDAAFYPLYPVLERGVGAVLGGQYLVAGLLISSISMIAALTLLHHLVQADVDNATAKRSVVYLALGPASFFCLAAYPEATFLALSVAALLAARRRRWAMVGILAGAAALARPTGLILVVPLAVEAAVDLRARWRAGATWFPPAQTWILLPAITFLGYQVYAAVGLGLPLGTLTAEVSWGQHLVAPWTVMLDAVRAWPLNPPAEVFDLGAAIALVLALPVMWRRLPGSYAAYVGATAAMIWFREGQQGPLVSASRFVTMVFPLFVLLAMAGRRRWLNRCVLVGFFTAEVSLFAWYARFGFVG